jgi:hypothetical protein
MIDHDPDHGLRDIRHLMHQQTAKGLSVPLLQRHRLIRQLTELQLVVAGQFADLNGWKVSATDFRPQDIGHRNGRFFTIRNSCWDHCLLFRGQGVCSAIVSQPYHDNEIEAEIEAKQYGLTMHVPPYSKSSIWYPGHARFWCFTSPSHRMRWLPEQLVGIRGKPVLTVVK